MKKNYKLFFISFIEEWWRGQDPKWRLGRIEISVEDEMYPIWEIRWHVKEENWEEWEWFRESWDFKDLTRDELARMIRMVRKKFQN